MDSLTPVTKILQQRLATQVILNSGKLTSKTNHKRVYVQLIVCELCVVLCVYVVFVGVWVCTCADEARGQRPVSSSVSLLLVLRQSTHLPLPPKQQDYKHVPPCLASFILHDS